MNDERKDEQEKPDLGDMVGSAFDEEDDDFLDEDEDDDAGDAPSASGPAPYPRDMDPSQRGMDPSQKDMDPSQKDMDPSQRGMDPSQRGRVSRRLIPEDEDGSVEDGGAGDSVERPAPPRPYKSLLGGGASADTEDIEQDDLPRVHDLGALANAMLESQGEGEESDSDEDSGASEKKGAGADDSSGDRASGASQEVATEDGDGSESEASSEGEEAAPEDKGVGGAADFMGSAWKKQDSGQAGPGEAESESSSEEELLQGETKDAEAVSQDAVLSSSPPPAPLWLKAAVAGGTVLFFGGIVFWQLNPWSGSSPADPADFDLPPSVSVSVEDPPDTFVDPEADPESVAVIKALAPSVDMPDEGPDDASVVFPDSVEYEEEFDEFSQFEQGISDLVAGVEDVDRETPAFLGSGDEDIEEVVESDSDSPRQDEMRALLAELAEIREAQARLREEQERSFSEMVEALGDIGLRIILLEEWREKASAVPRPKLGASSSDVDRSRNLSGPLRSRIGPCGEEGRAVASRLGAVRVAAFEGADGVRWARFISAGGTGRKGWRRDIRSGGRLPVGHSGDLRVWVDEAGVYGVVEIPDSSPCLILWGKSS